MGSESNRTIVCRLYCVCCILLLFNISICIIHIYQKIFFLKKCFYMSCMWLHNIFSSDYVAIFVNMQSGIFVFFSKWMLRGSSKDITALGVFGVKNYANSLFFFAKCRGEILEGGLRKCLRFTFLYEIFTRILGTYTLMFDQFSSLGRRDSLVIWLKMDRLFTRFFIFPNFVY